MNKPARRLAEAVLARPTSQAELDALADLAREVLGPRRRKGKVIAVGKMKPRRETKAEERRSTRPIVEARAGGVCEVRALGGCRGRLVWDHFWGRGKVPPSVEAEWMLCEEHNHRKTDWQPTRVWWIGVFRMHCAMHGYAEQVAKCDGAMSLEEAQHPESRSERSATP